MNEPIIQQKFIDLHIHSTASDGSESPGQIVRMAAELAGEAPFTIALTDHDSTAGHQEFLEAAAEFEGQITALPGIEVSTLYKGESVHILGYGISDDQSTPLNKRMEISRECRDSRNSKIIALLQKKGFDISEEDLPKPEDGSSIGRPHIARAMMKKGYVDTVGEAFDKYIGAGRDCYVDREDPDPEEAVDLIIQAGGVPVMAHPMLYTKLSQETLEELIRLLIGHGLAGIETYYSYKNQSVEKQLYVAGLAEKYHLFSTGGSDFHGIPKPQISLFTGYGELAVPAYVPDHLQKKIAAAHRR